VINPLVLIILDGFGLSEEKEGNAIALAKKPYIDKLFSEYPNTIVRTSGEAVGLPEGQMGNSEVGHLNLGAGRIVYQDYSRINKAIDDGSFFSNEILQRAISHVKEYNSSLHLMGLLSDGGVHSHINHLYSLLKMAKNEEVERVYIHIILDGRDTHPKSAKKYIADLEGKITELGIGRIITVSGRYYSMDRDNRWERTKKAYDAIVLGEGLRARNAQEAVDNSYKEGNNDEFLIPTVLLEENEFTVFNDNDAFIFFNFRADRPRQITQALALKEFKGFKRPSFYPKNIYFVCMTEYDREYKLPIAFPPLDITNGLGEILSKNGLKQLRIAETEKYAHVTFFFNGGIEKTFSGEDRILIPSPKVATYDLKPEMSAYEVTDKLLENLADDKYHVIIMNYANPDMVGHTGVLEAAIKAIEVIDELLSKIVPAILDRGGQILLTADHGNSEKMKDSNGEAFTAHTTNPVPLIYIGGPKGVKIKEGKLADIAPTMLNILDINKPEEMTGESLLIK
jgi:2,3-bisphosphoglycerate-independent phosphoglycerate mutase